MRWYELSESGAGKLSFRSGSWGRIFWLFLLLLSPVLPLFGQMPDSLAASSQTQKRIKAKFEVLTANETPFVGMVILVSDGGDRVYLHPNRFGLAFVDLLPETRYSVSVDGFPKFTHLVTSSLEEGDMENELILPPTVLHGQTAQEGHGLILFTYLDKDAQPLADRLLYCTADNGQFYTGRTDRFGKARVEVPLGHRYTFSVEEQKEFDEHTFTLYPPLQTAEISLMQGKPHVKKKPAVTQQRTISQRKVVPAKPRFYTRRDSLQAATRRIKPKPIKTKQSPQAFTIPVRATPQTEPIVAKRILEGVYMLRNVVQRESRVDTLFINHSQLTLLQTLDRKVYDSAVYVVDVTCSMDFFLDEYLLWLSLTEDTPHLLGGVFFNDGDNLPDEAKPIGMTGGIRATSSTLEEATEVLATSISYDCGGAAPENDLEALLYAQAHFPEAKQFILVADNGSDVRDLELLSQLEKPVHVILCSPSELGEKNPPNADYVSIAQATGGSLSSLREDLQILQDSKKPNEITVGRWKYLRLKNRFVRPPNATHH